MPQYKYTIESKDRYIPFGYTSTHAGDARDIRQFSRIAPGYPCPFAQAHVRYLPYYEESLRQARLQETTQVLPQHLSAPAFQTYEPLVFLMKWLLNNSSACANPSSVKTTDLF